MNWVLLVIGAVFVVTGVAGMVWLRRPLTLFDRVLIAWACGVGLFAVAIAVVAAVR